MPEMLLILLISVCTVSEPLTVIDWPLRTTVPPEPVLRSVDGGDAGIDAGIGGRCPTLSAGRRVVDGDGDRSALRGDAAEGAADVDARDVLGVDDRSRDTGRAVEQFLGSELRLLGDALDAGDGRS